MEPPRTFKKLAGPLTVDSNAFTDLWAVAGRLNGVEFIICTPNIEDLPKVWASTNMEILADMDKARQVLVAPADKVTQHLDDLIGGEG